MRISFTYIRSTQTLTESSYEVTANPTLLFVKDAEVLDRKVGAQKPADLKAWVEELL